MPRAILAAAVCSSLSPCPPSAQDAEAGRPRPAPVDHPAGPQADDGGAGDQVAAPGRQRHEPQRAERRQLRRVEGQAVHAPRPARLKDGTKVTTAEQWWTKRRPEIVEDFDREVYGRVPKDVPKVTWEVTETTEEKVGDIPAVTKRLVGHVDNSRCPQIKVDIQLTLTTPADAKGPVPVMMEFGFGGFGPRPGGPAGEGGHAEGDAQGRVHRRGLRRRRPVRGSSRSSPRAGATPSSSPTASRPTTARG